MFSVLTFILAFVHVARPSKLKKPAECPMDLEGDAELRFDVSVVGVSDRASVLLVLCERPTTVAVAITFGNLLYSIKLYHTEEKFASCREEEEDRRHRRYGQGAERGSSLQAAPWESARPRCDVCVSFSTAWGCDLFLQEPAWRNSRVTRAHAAHAPRLARCAAVDAHTCTQPVIRTWRIPRPAARWRPRNRLRLIISRAAARWRP